MRSFNKFLYPYVSDLTALSEATSFTKDVTSKDISCTIDGSDCPSIVWKVNNVRLESTNAWFAYDVNQASPNVCAFSVTSTITVAREAITEMEKLTCEANFEDTSLEALSTDTALVLIGLFPCAYRYISLRL